ncbi:MAG: hypothetical protein EpisKO_07470 [Epibacterium sp.]
MGQPVYLPLRKEKTNPHAGSKNGRQDLPRAADFDLTDANVQFRDFNLVHDFNPAQARRSVETLD